VTRTSAQLLKHREIQVGRGVLVVLAAIAWVAPPNAVDPNATVFGQFALILLFCALALGGWWVILLHRTGRLHEASFWKTVGLRIGLILAVAVLCLMTSSSTTGTP